MDVKVFRLVSGEEIICFAKKETNGYYLEKPCFIVPTEKGVGLMDMMPYTNISKKGIRIQSQSIVFVTEAVEGLEEQLKQAHGAIITQNKKLIL